MFVIFKRLNPRKLLALHFMFDKCIKLLIAVGNQRPTTAFESNTNISHTTNDNTFNLSSRNPWNHQPSASNVTNISEAITGVTNFPIPSTSNNPSISSFRGSPFLINDQHKSPAIVMTSSSTSRGY